MTIEINNMLINLDNIKIIRLCKGQFNDFLLIDGEPYEVKEAKKVYTVIKNLLKAKNALEMIKAKQRVKTK